MGRLSGIRYRELIKRLKKLGFQFDRQAAGSHEIWYSPEADRYTTIPTILVICRKEQFGLF
jgi:predicted RNA binding protein YcfA (HicA-like mRNA interferase family)